MARRLPAPVRAILVLIPALLLAGLAWWLMGGATSPAPAPANRSDPTPANDAGDDSAAATNTDHQLVAPENRPPGPDLDPDGANLPPDTRPSDNPPPPPDAENARRLQICDWKGRPIAARVLLWASHTGFDPRRFAIPTEGLLIDWPGSGPLVGLAADGGIVSCMQLCNEQPDRNGTIQIAAAEPGCGWIDPDMRGVINGGPGSIALAYWPLQAWVRVVDGADRPVVDAQVGVGTVEPPGNDGVIRGPLVNQVGGIVVHAAPAPLVAGGDLYHWFASATHADGRISRPARLGSGVTTLRLGAVAHLKIRVIDPAGQPFANRQMVFAPRLETRVPFSETIHEILQLSASNQLTVLSGTYQSDAAGVIDLGTVPAGKWAALPPAMDSGPGLPMPSPAYDRWSALWEVPAGESTLDLTVGLCAQLELRFVTPYGNPVTPGEVVLLAHDQAGLSAGSWVALHAAPASERAALIELTADALQTERAGIAEFVKREGDYRVRPDGPIPMGLQSVLTPQPDGLLRLGFDHSGTMQLVAIVGPTVIPLGPIRVRPGETHQMTAVLLHPWHLQPPATPVQSEILVRPIRAAAGLSWVLRDGEGNLVERGSVDPDGVVRIREAASGRHRLVVDYLAADGPGGVYPCEFHLRPDPDSPERHLTDLTDPATLILEPSADVEPEPEDPVIAARLDQPAPPVAWDDAEARDGIRDLGRLLGLPVVASPDADADLDGRVSLALGPVNGRQLVGLMADLLGLSWNMRGGRIQFTYTGEARFGDYGGPSFRLVDAAGHEHYWAGRRAELRVVPGPLQLVSTASGSVNRLVAEPGVTQIHRVGPLTTVDATSVTQLMDDRELPAGLVTFGRHWAHLLPGRYRVAGAGGTTRDVLLPDDAQPGKPGEPHWLRVE